MARFSAEGDEDGNGEGASNKPVSKKRPHPSDLIADTPKRATASTSTSNSGAAPSASCLSTPTDTQIRSVQYWNCSYDPMEEEFAEEEAFEEEEEEETDAAEEDEDEVEEEDEDEEHEDIAQPTEAPVESNRNGNINGMVAPVPISVTLTDADLLDCPICFEPLNPPVYQCENGHVACATCCTKMRHKCGSCSWPIGYNRCRAIEKILDSLRISCCNTQLGCTECLRYSKKLEHETTCKYAPCRCPHPGCTFSGSSKSIYSHFSTRHPGSLQRFSFNTASSVSVDSRQKQVYLQERSDSTLFVVDCCGDDLGSFVSVVCIAEAGSGRRFAYDLSARDGESTIKLTSVAENSGRWVETTPLEKKKFLLVPKDYVKSSGDLLLVFTIWNGRNEPS